ncbi:hypothetical protein PG994_003307 [Apiospora phragmitis]|uniref:Uncharacterized protein n=1 Tax=Apiospora phragmitis TaxID=2905665 RepID=A0ABR1VXP0_9PEZI
MSPYSYVSRRDLANNFVLTTAITSIDLATMKQTLQKITAGDMVVLDRIDWDKFARMAGFKSARDAQAFYITLGEDKPGGQFAVTPLDMMILDDFIYDIFTACKVNWDLLARRSSFLDARAAQSYYCELATFESEMNSDIDTDDMAPPAFPDLVEKFKRRNEDDELFMRVGFKVLDFCDFCPEAWKAICAITG